jgi:hypothetical protein
MEARPLAAWMQVLGRIEESLVKTLERWGEPDIPAPPPTPEAGGPAARTVLQNIDQRFERMRTCLELAGRQAAEVEAQLAAEGRAVEDWLQAVAGTRQRVESCVNQEAEANG